MTERPGARICPCDKRLVPCDKSLMRCDKSLVCVCFRSAAHSTQEEVCDARQLNLASVQWCSFHSPRSAAVTSDRSREQTPSQEQTASASPCQPKNEASGGESRLHLPSFSPVVFTWKKL